MSANDGQGTHGGPKAIAVPQAMAGTVVRQEFGANQVARGGETASTALAAQASAAVQARYVMALQRPRDILIVRKRLLADCARRAFAKKAIYRKPIGAGVEGPSIRMAEAAARAMGNIFTDVFAIYDDAQRRIVRVCSSDLEANLTFTKDVTIEKTMERSKLQEGQAAISTRTNSRGYPVYLVAATDDDILNKENALASKAMRTCLLRLIPGDILDEAMNLCYQTQSQEIEEDPGREKKLMCDDFGEIGVSAEMLRDYLGHPIDETTIPEMATMKRLFIAIQDGEATWLEAIEQKRAKGDAQPPGAPTTVTPGPANGKKSVDDLAARAKAQREGGAKPVTTAAPMPPAKPADPADAISKGPGPAAKPGQQAIPMSRAAAPVESDEDRRNREAAAPDPDEMPEWGGGPKR